MTDLNCLLKVANSSMHFQNYHSKCEGKVLFLHFKGSLLSVARSAASSLEGSSTPLQAVGMVREKEMLSSPLKITAL